MATDSFLHRYFVNNAHKFMTKWLHYFDVYERHFERFRNQPVTLLEIGVFEGGSLPMWRDYLGPQAKIIGLDINPACKAHEGPGIEVVIGSQDDPNVLKAILDRHPRIDIVIDDGSHRMEHIAASFRYLYPRLHSHGVYLVEDLHTCYWPEFGGGLKREESFIEIAKSLIDELNAVHSRGAVPLTPFTSSTFSMSFYDSIIAFEKRPQGRRQTVKTEPMPKRAPTA